MLSSFRRAARRHGRIILPAILCGASLLTAQRASAATILYRTDAQLVAQADRVVHGRVLDVRSEWDTGRRTIQTIARIAVLEDFTGMTEPVIEVRELGGGVGDVQMWIPGAPRFVPGEEVVLCLARRGTQWRTVALEFSTFRLQPQPDGNPILIRELAGTDLVGAPAGAAGAAAADAAPRRLSDFRQIVADVKGAQAVRPGGEQFIEEGPVSAPFHLLANIRWRQADTDTPVPWYRNPSAAAPVMGGNVDALIPQALAAWTNPTTARLTLNFGGQRSIAGAPPICPLSAMNAGVITFEDPDDSIDSPVLAIGGGCHTAGSEHTINGTTFTAIIIGFVIFNNAAELSAGIREPANFLRVLAHEIGHGIGLDHSCGNGTGETCTPAHQVNLMFPSCCAAASPNPPEIGPDDLAGVNFIYPMPVGPPPDTDTDGLPDDWETNFGLNPNLSSSPHGAGDDPDGDGATNLQEFQNGTHPRGDEQRYFAEGVNNAFFETQIALLNPGVTQAIVLLRLQPQDGAEIPYRIVVPANSRRTVDPITLGGLTSAPFATLIESDEPIVADRTVTWGAGGYGSHTETAVLEPATTWYLAEGATGGGFDLYYLLQNSNNTAVQVDVTYLLPFGQAPVVKRYTVGARSRMTIWVDDEQFPEGSGNRQLSATDVSAHLQVVGGGPPVIVERAMYYSLPGQTYAAGHESAGVPELGQNRTNWFFAEGATGSFFDTYVLLANPGTTAANVTATYLLTSGATFQKAYTLSPQSRSTIWVDEEEIPAGSGQRPLANVDVSTTIASNVPIIAERSMWWPQGAWYEAHNTAGATVSGTRWAIAEGEVGGARNAQTFLLVANVGDQPANIRITLMTESGQSIVWPATGSPAHTLPARSRFTVPVDATRFPGITSQRFGAIVESQAGQSIVVERSNYYNVPGGLWPSGGAALASRLSP